VKNDRFDFAGKTSLISGGSTGIARATAFALRHRIRKAITAVGFLAAVIASASAADARMRHADYQEAREAVYDGRWSVVIETERGACDRSYRVGVDIAKGTVSYGGTPYGRVSGTGAVRVSLVMGDQQAQGAGRLRRTSGSGTWRGFGKVGACSGHWMAERRD
jgi:hypothetical protein